jgi:nicotinamidase-related amidase
MLNRYEHADADRLAESVREALPAMCSVLERARERDTLTVYVNDNYGDWSAGRTELCAAALRGRHRALVEPVLAADGVPFLVKARHSAFYETQLEYVLRRHRVERIVLIGQVTEQCILYTALDAYVRHYRVAVARDAVAHIHPDLARAALRMMDLNMGAEIVLAQDCDLDGLPPPGAGNRGASDHGGDEMAKDHGPSVKDDKQYEGLRRKGMSKERAAKIANTPNASSKGGKSSGRKSAKQGAGKAQKAAAGRKGAKAANRSRGG